LQADGDSSAGRAATIAANRQSFDLCDDGEGLDAGREIKANAGKLYKPPTHEGTQKEEAPPKEAKTAEVPSEVPNGVEETGVEPKTNGITAQ
jgi:hypothetical protein